MKELLKFTAPWCKACKAMSALLEATPLKDCELKEIDVDDSENQDLATKYGIRSLPTMVLLKDGEEVERFIGATPVNKLQESINNF